MTAWMQEGACRDASGVNFFPEAWEDWGAARAVCATCPVISECAAYALADASLHGIWGGTSERQRRRRRSSQYAVRT